MIRAALLSVAGATAVCAAAVPAIVGMMGNTSFTHHIPVRVPVGASTPHLAPTGPLAVPFSSRTSVATAERPTADSSRHSHSLEPSEHSTSGTDDRDHHRGRGNRTASSSTGGGSGSGRHGDGRSGRG